MKKRRLIKISDKFLFEYLRNNNLILSIGFDLIRIHNKNLEGYELNTKNFEINEENLRYFLCIENKSFNDKLNSFSHIFGKRYIEVPEDFTESMLNLLDEYKDFIIGVDDFGNEQTFTCDENKLANSFGANLNAPHFLTPIFFKKEVLNKYYSEPSKYSVKDGSLSCYDLWNICIDNDLDKNVVVFLGDLGRLPYKEQEYWRIYNISEGEIITRSVTTIRFARPSSFTVAIPSGSVSSICFW